MEVEALKREAQAQRKAQQYAAALVAYAQLWQAHPAACGEWEAWGYAYCLKQEKRYAEALDVCRAAYPRWPGSPLLNGLYAWCIYWAELAPSPVADQARFLRAAGAVLRLCRPGDPHSAHQRAVFRVLGHLHQQASYPAAAVLEWTAHLDPAHLPAQPRPWTTPGGKVQVLAPPLEQYYAWRTRALLASGQPAACAALCREALAALPQFHHGNETWLARRLAQALAALGQPQAALDQLNALLARREEWFIRHEAALLHAQLGDHATALRQAAAAALAPGDPPKKLKLYHWLGQALDQAGQPGLALAHFGLEAALRRANQWPIGPALAQRTAQGPAQPWRQALAALRPEWERLAHAGQPRLQGRVSALLPHGRAGFVQADGGAAYYFRADQWGGPPTDLRPGLAVSFGLAPGHDPKKNRPTQVAVRLQPLPAP
jgi:hypothetical protein